MIVESKAKRRERLGIARTVVERRRELGLCKENTGREAAAEGADAVTQVALNPMDFFEQTKMTFVNIFFFTLMISTIQGNHRTFNLFNIVLKF